MGWRMWKSSGTPSGPSGQNMPSGGDWSSAPVPNLYESEIPACGTFSPGKDMRRRKQAPRRRTLLMDLGPSLDELQRGLHQKWRYHLNKSRKQPLEIIEGEEDHLFAAFRKIFGEMVDRAQLVNFTDRTSAGRPRPPCRPGKKSACSCARSRVRSAPGASARRSATRASTCSGPPSNRGIKTHAPPTGRTGGCLEWVREQGCRWYDLNGINPEKIRADSSSRRNWPGSTWGGMKPCWAGMMPVRTRPGQWLLGMGDRLRAVLKKNHG